MDLDTATITAVVLERCAAVRAAINSSPRRTVCLSASGRMRSQSTYKHKNVIILPSLYRTTHWWKSKLVGRRRRGTRNTSNPTFPAYYWSVTRICRCDHSIVKRRYNVCWATNGRMTFVRGIMNSLWCTPIAPQRGCLPQWCFFDRMNRACW